MNPRFFLLKVLLTETDRPTANRQLLSTIKLHRIGAPEAMDGYPNHNDRPHPGNKGVGSRAWACFMSMCSFLKAQFTTSGEKVTGRRLLLVTIALMVNAFFAEIDRQLLVTAMPKITTEFHSLEQAAWYQASHDLARLAFLPIFGRVYTLFPLKITYCANILVFVIGAYLLPCCSWATRGALLIIRFRISRLRNVVDFPHLDCRSRHPGRIACWHEFGRLRHNLSYRFKEEDAAVPG